MNTASSSADRQHATFDDFLQAEMGIGPGVFLLDEAQKASLEGASLPQKQALFVNFLMDKLRSAGAFASPDEDASHYLTRFEIHAYSAPEDFKGAPSSSTEFDARTSKPKIFRNPFLFTQYYTPDEVLFAHLQGALFWSYLQQSGEQQFSLAASVGIFERIISFADTCGFGEDFVTYLRAQRDKFKVELLSPSHDLPQ